MTHVLVRNATSLVGSHLSCDYSWRVCWSTKDWASASFSNRSRDAMKIALCRPAL